MGQSGKSSEVGPITKVQAISQYHKKFSEKTDENSEKYRIVEMSYNEGEEVTQSESATNESQKKDTIPCSLDPKVQNLKKLIFDMHMMNSQMK